MHCDQKHVKTWKYVLVHFNDVTGTTIYIASCSTLLAKFDWLLGYL